MRGSHRRSRITSRISPAELKQIISKTLRKDREERYHNAHELLEALKELRRKLEFKAELEGSPADRSWLRRTRSRTVVVLILLVAALALALPFYWHRNVTTATSVHKSIAVLPFENASKDPNAEYLSEGISEALINSLSELQRLRVIARSTAFQVQRQRC